MFKNRLILSALFLVLAYFGTAIAEELTAFQIMEKVDNRLIPVDMTSDMTMSIIDKKGRSRNRAITSFRMGDDKSIMWFQEPADVKGSSFLRISHDERDDDMWLYLPAFGKVRRIASSAKNGSFMGSDFTYEDMGDRKVKDYDYEILGSEELDSRLCWKIQSVPKKGVVTDYSKSVLWVWQDQFMVIKGDLYDKRGGLKKKMIVTPFQSGKYWIAEKLVMENLKRKGKTRISFQNIQVDTGLKDDLFNSRQLTRIR
jgi:outer membrane lipoprotein-sorting protein